MPPKTSPDGKYKSVTYRLKPDDVLHVGDHVQITVKRAHDSDVAVLVRTVVPVEETVRIGNREAVTRMSPKWGPGMDGTISNQYQREDSK